MESATTDRIEKSTRLRTPISRVWHAISDASEFGAWFRAKFDDPFEPGRKVRGRITYPGFEHLTLELEIESMDPQRLFSFRWHPYAVDPRVDYSAEPTTLVELRLEELPDGTQLTVVESGFGQIPAERRAEAFRMNERGWKEQLKSLEQHLRGD